MMTAFAKTDHSAHIFEMEILVSHSALIALHNGEVRIAIVHAVLQLRTSRYECPKKIILSRNKAFQ